jgi:hypothetical protein
MVHAAKAAILLSLFALTQAFPYCDHSSSTTCPSDSDSSDLPNAYTLHVHHQNIQEDLRGRKIDASGQAFHIGLPGPSTYCPQPPVPICPPGNDTVFSGLVSMVCTPPNITPTQISNSPRKTSRMS